MIIAVQPDEAGEWKESLEWHFESFCANGDFEPSELWADVESKARQLWVIYDDEIKAAVLTTVRPGRRKTLEITHGAGQDRHSWQHLWEALRPWGKSIGCERIVFIARPGWERVFPSLKKTHVILEGDL